ncbi:hypothetical protein VE03_10895 [Pseudogymnoascus sp. 23342-1-I1]|nr:hypothetical protein VE03_10895 [Pseudogymnoascus sp. 23342-1-I1]
MQEQEQGEWIGLGRHSKNGARNGARREERWEYGSGKGHKDIQEIARRRPANGDDSLGNNNGLRDGASPGPREEGGYPGPRAGTRQAIFLLGMLTLTARFIPDFVAYHSPSDPSEALAASEFYAKAFAARLDASAMTLMISLYHWGMCRSRCAWMYITIAIGMAQMMQLMFEDDPRKY